MVHARRSALTVLLVALAALPAAAAQKRGLCDAAASGAPIVVLSAFPAESLPLVRAASIDQSVDIDGRRYHVGRLEGMRIVLGLTGIGMLNAAARTTTVIQSFKPAAIVFSGVAGSTHRIAEVGIASHWLEVPTKRVFPVNPALLEIATLGAAALPAPLEKCATVPPTSATGALVCMPFDPQVFFPDQGQTDDPYGNTPAACAPGNDPILGCNIPEPAARGVVRPAAGAAPEIVDMETATVARIAKHHGVPFVGMRAVSDGAGDPKGDRGFPAQFFDYYQLSADNAALVTRAFLAEVHRLSQDPASRRVCKLLDRRHWKNAAKVLRASSSSSIAASQ